MTIVSASASGRIVALPQKRTLIGKLCIGVRSKPANNIITNVSTVPVKLGNQIVEITMEQSMHLKIWGMMCTILFCAPLQAALVSYDFTGEIVSFTTNLGVSLDDPVSGTFSFDDGLIPLANASELTTFRADSPLNEAINPSFAAQLFVGSQAFPVNPSTKRNFSGLQTVIPPRGQAVFTYAASDPIVNEIFTATFLLLISSISVTEPTAGIDDVVTLLDEVAEADFSSFIVNEGRYGRASSFIDFRFLSLNRSVQAEVPEPSSLALLCGCIVLLIRSRNKIFQDQ